MQLYHQRFINITHFLFRSLQLFCHVFTEAIGFKNFYHLVKLYIKKKSEPFLFYHWYKQFQYFTNQFGRLQMKKASLSQKFTLDVYMFSDTTRNGRDIHWGCVFPYPSRALPEYSTVELYQIVLCCAQCTINGRVELYHSVQLLYQSLP